MVSACKQCLPSWRAERSGVKAVVLQPAGGQLFKVRSLAGSAEGAGRREAHVVEQDDQYVGCAFGGTQRLDRRKLRIGVFGVIGCEADVWLGRNGKDGTRMRIGALRV